MSPPVRRRRPWTAGIVVLILLFLAAAPFLWIFFGQLRRDPVDELLNRRQFDRALQRVDQAMANAPGDGHLLCQRAFAYWALGDFDQAGRATEQVLTGKSRDGLAYGVRALMLIVQGDTTEAESQANSYVSSSSKQWRAYWVRGIVLRDSEKLDAALSDFDAAMQLAGEPEQKSLCYAYRASVHLQRDNQSALRDADIAVNLAPEIPIGYLIRAIVLERIKNHAESQRDVRTYARLVPQEAEAARLIVQEVAAGAAYTEQLAARIRYAIAQPNTAAP